MVESTTKKLDQYLDSDKQEIVNQHPNVRGDTTVVFENKDTGDRKTFPNVSPDKLEGGGGLEEGGENIDRGGSRGGGGGSGKQGFASMPKEEVREIASKGGKASGEARRARSDNIL